MPVSTKLGATPLPGDCCEFLVWAPRAERVAVRILQKPDCNEAHSPCRHHSDDRLVELQKCERGYHHSVIEGVPPGSRYVYCLDGKKDRPDPASTFQPAGVHGASQVVAAHDFNWTENQWRGLPLEKYIIYEVHVGAYTPEGTFDAIIPHLNGIKNLGITALELMPVAQFPGARNWGYDGVYPFAVQNSYGGPDGLRRLVDACHDHGLAAVLDVVYNHLGPEGNYLADFGPYFTDRYRSPWGEAINFDGEESDEVVRYFSENALQWVRDYHFDALRLDAIHGIIDCNAQPFLQLLGQTIQEFARHADRRVYLIAESDLNDSRYIRPRESGGYGLDAQWSDDFHHALHTLLTGEQTGYYLDFGKISDLAEAFREGYVYSGRYSAYRRCRHGNSSRDIPARQFVVFTQNHDQVGNRLRGERISTLVSFEASKLAAGIVILCPYIPLLFMGEEWGETAPFQYFTSHSDPDVIAAVRRGRREEFATFRWQGEPLDAQDEKTFLQSKIDHNLKTSGSHRTLLGFYKELIRLRKTLPALSELSKDHLAVEGLETEKILTIRRRSARNGTGGHHAAAKNAGEAEVLMVANFSARPETARVEAPDGEWQRLLDSADPQWEGPGNSAPRAFTPSGVAELVLQPTSILLFAKQE